MKRQVRLTVCLLGTLLTGLDVGMWANVMVPFLEAAPTADAVVLARYLDSDASHLRFGIIETYRGKVSIGLVTVPNGLWSYVSQQFPDDGLKSARFLLLLNADGSLRCGHFGTLIVLCGTCLGVIPVIDGSVPEAYRSSLGRSGSSITSLEQVKTVLVGARDGG